MSPQLSALNKKLGVQNLWQLQTYLYIFTQNFPKCREEKDDSVCYGGTVKILRKEVKTVRRIAKVRWHGSLHSCGTVDFQDGHTNTLSHPPPLLTVDRHSFHIQVPSISSHWNRRGFWLPRPMGYSRNDAIYLLRQGHSWSPGSWPWPGSSVS